MKMKIVPCRCCAANADVRKKPCGSYEFDELFEGRFRPEDVEKMIFALSQFKARLIASEPAKDPPPVHRNRQRINWCE